MLGNHMSEKEIGMWTLKVELFPHFMDYFLQVAETWPFCKSWVEKITTFLNKIYSEKEKKGLPGLPSLECWSCSFV